MATSSTADSSRAPRDETAAGSDSDPASGDDPDPAPGTDADSRNDDTSPSRDDADSSSLADKLDTIATVIWATFLASVVVFTLIPVVALWFGAVPFDPPPTRPYFALVGFALVGTAGLILAAVYDV